MTGADWLNTLNTAGVFAGVLVGLKIAGAGIDVAYARIKNGRNGRNERNGKPSFNPATCTERDKRIRALETKHDSGEGFDLNLCRKHGEGMARLEVGARAQWESADRRFEGFNQAIGELASDVKELTSEVHRMLPKP